MIHPEEGHREGASAVDGRSSPSGPGRDDPRPARPLSLTAVRALPLLTVLGLRLSARHPVPTPAGLPLAVRPRLPVTRVPARVRVAAHVRGGVGGVVR